MKRTIFVFAFLILFTILMVGIGEAKSSTPRFFINGKEVSVGEITPMVINGKVFLSIDEIEQILGLKIKWDSSHNVFIIQNSTSTITPSSSVLNSIPATMTVSTVATQGMILKLAAAKAMPLKLLWWKESNTTIVGPFDDGYHIYSAQPGMKFVTLVYRITNNWVESKDVPDIEGYIKTDKGYYYSEWSSLFENNYKIATQKEINAFLGKYNGYKSTLLPGCSTKGWITFEIPKNEKPVEIVIGVYARIILKGAF